MLKFLIAEELDGLVNSHVEHFVYVLSTVSHLQDVVLEPLAKGPMEEGHYATIPDSSLVLSVIIADRICYINMNSTFRDETPEVGENISIYSVVNSIIDSCDVDRVQISIEGSTEGNFQDSLPLYKFYEKNEDLIAQDEEPK